MFKNNIYHKSFRVSNAALTDAEETETEADREMHGSPLTLWGCVQGVIYQIFIDRETDGRYLNLCTAQIPFIVQYF